MKYFLIFICINVGLITNAQQYQLDGNKVVISMPVTFIGNTSVLTDDGKAAVLIIKQYLNDKKYISLLRIESNVAPNKPSINAQSLSAQRALAVYETLVNAGVSCKRLIPVAFGDTKPLVAITTPNNNDKNTYIQFVNVSINNRVIGGLPIDGGGVIVPITCTD